jgi:hypothetical protein
MPSLLPQLFHATRRSSLRNILKFGLQRSRCGDIHGAMALRPPEDTVYLSKNASSNNLNTKLFDTGEEIVLLQIDPGFIDANKIYPDDALFCAFANEDVFEDAEDVAKDLGMSTESAQHLLSHWESLDDKLLVQDMKKLWPWYLENHGEISVAQDVPASSIVCVRSYESGNIIWSKKDIEPKSFNI